MKKAPLVLSFLLVFCLFNFISDTRVSANNKIMVGVFYYPWYDGEGYHCNGHPSNYSIDRPDTWWTVIDVPVLGNTSNSTYCMYASDNVTVIKQHLDWFKYSGIDFGIISWWGNNSFEDNHTDILFNVTSSYAPWFRWVISIESCYNVTTQGLGYLAYLREYVYQHYASTYHEIWLNDTNSGKPFLFWMNADDLTNDTVQDEAKNDTRFVTRLLGQANYSDWKTWTPYTYGGATSAFPPSMNEFMCVMPRYDETGLAPNRIRCGDKYLNGSDWETVDPLNEPLYDYQWKEVLSNASAGKVQYVGIATWNDFTERTQIEPCWDNTSAYEQNPYFLLNRTEYWINKLPVIDEFQPLLVLPLFMLATLAAVIVYKRKGTHLAQRQNHA
jgi:hypothetical protein